MDDIVRRLGNLAETSIPTWYAKEMSDKLNAVVQHLNLVAKYEEVPDPMVLPPLPKTIRVLRLIPQKAAAKSTKKAG
ncbi:MAG TPA: hypothetical protein VLC46_26760 [Thermoanaerobaculia bacterium]|jgi:hypothetical protein|nr:hypothetical protein [Thermoanaerobaculia bacterium]